MFSYYLVVFTLILLSFRERRVFCLGLLCILNLICIPLIVGSLYTDNSTFYVYTSLLEVLFLGLATITYPLHEGKGVIFLFSASLLLNLIGAFDSDVMVQQLIDTHYELINTLLFEVMIGILIANTSWAINLSDKLKGNKPC